MSAAASISHLPFFEALAAETDEGSAVWRQCTAGLLTLRLFDVWLRHIRRGEAPVEASRVAAVRAAIEEVDEDATVRPVLLGLVGAMATPTRRVDVVRGHLLAYAKRLQLDARWTLAADVFRTYVASREPDDVSTDVMEAAFKCGYCFRMAGDLDEAAVAYDLGEALAIAARDTFNMLRARIVQTKLTMHRGNLPQAEAELDAIIRAAEEANCRRALSEALTDRMAVAGRRGQYEAAATFGYRALETCENELERERILSDIATALGDAGRREAARDAHLVLSRTARDRSVAWLSTANLLVLAVEDGDELSFQRYRRVLADAQLPAELHARVELAVGDGHRRFGQDELAASAYESALRIAERHRVNDVVLKAEAALEALRRAARAPAPAEVRPSTTVTIDDVVRAMRELRETVYAGA